MSISKRHHYIPQFLIKRFTGENSMLYVYDKEEDRFLSGMKSPKSIFFEWNRNTLETAGQANDLMEKLYSELDSDFAQKINKITTTGRIEVEDLTALAILALTLKWRLPANDDKFETENQKYSYENLPIEVKLKNDDGADHSEAFKHLLGSETFKQAKRMILPFLPFYEGNQLSATKMLALNEKGYMHSNDTITSILSDNPLIEDSSSAADEFGNFILPLGNGDTFICSNNKPQGVKGYSFYTNKDLAVFHQAEKYVACKDRMHLEKIIEAYNELQRSGQVHLIPKCIFQLT